MRKKKRKWEGRIGMEGWRKSLGVGEGRRGGGWGRQTREIEGENSGGVIKKIIK